MIEKIKFDSVLLFLTLFLVFSMFYCIFLEKGGGGKKMLILMHLILTQSKT